MHVLAKRLSEVAGRDPKATKSHRISCSKEADRLSIIDSIMLTLRQPKQLRPGNACYDKTKSTRNKY